MVKFLKYKFYNKLLGGVTLLKVTPGITWTQLIYIYIYVCVCARVHVECPRSEKDKEHDVPHQTICKVPQFREGGPPE